MKALEELTAEIREKLPRLMELKEGQRIIALVSDEPNDIYQGSIEIIGENAELLESGEVEIGGYEYQIGVDYDILGLEPMLNDVLEWHSKYYSKNSHFEVFNIVMNSEKHPAGVFLDYSEEDTARFIWDLSQPYLKDQSPEHIYFLHALIKQ